MEEFCFLADRRRAGVRRLRAAVGVRRSASRRDSGQAVGHCISCSCSRPGSSASSTRWSTPRTPGRACRRPSSFPRFVAVLAIAATASASPRSAREERNEMPAICSRARRARRPCERLRRQSGRIAIRPRSDSSRPAPRAAPDDEDREPRRLGRPAPDRAARLHDHARSLPVCRSRARPSCFPTATSWLPKGAAAASRR